MPEHTFLNDKSHRVTVCINNMNLTKIQLVEFRFNNSSISYDHPGHAIGIDDLCCNPVDFIEGERTDLARVLIEVIIR